MAGRPILAVALALGLLACGDDEQGGGGGSPTGTAAGAGTGGAGGSAGGSAAGGQGAGGAQGGAGGGSVGPCDALTMVFPAGDWEPSAPAAVGVDGDALDAAMDYYAAASGAQGTDQALVIRCGRLIWQGSDVDNVHNVWSVTKSFTSTVLGLLVDDGQCTTGTLGRDHLASLAAQYGAVTLGHFATMTSGYDGGGDQSDTPFTPTAPLFAPGSEFQYWDSAMNQFGNALTRIAGGPIEALFAARIADPIGMPAAAWDWADWGTVDGLVVNGGAGNKSRGIHVSARALARFGHLMLNRGAWDGQQLISRAWVDQATSSQVAAPLPSHTAGASGPGVYGYNWWTNGIGPGGERPWPEAPAETYAALGFNHNRMFVAPSWGMVIVRLGTDGDPPTHAETSTFFGMLAAALGE